MGVSVATGEFGARAEPLPTKTDPGSPKPEPVQPDIVAQMVAAVLALLVSAYLGWHWGGWTGINAERPALRFALLTTTPLCLILVVRGRPGPRSVVGVLGLAGLAGWSAVSAARSSSPSRALVVLPLIMWYGIVYLGAAGAFKAGAGTSLVNGLVCGGAVQAVVGLFDRWGAQDPMARTSGTFYSINPFAGFLVLLLPICVARALGARRGRVLLWTTLGAVMVAGLITSGSRGGLLCALGGFVLVLFLSKERLRARMARGVLIACLGIALSWFLSSSFAVGRSGSAGSVLKARSGTELTDAGQRLHWWLGAVRIWRDQPLLGSGPGTYGVALFSHQDSSWAWSMSAHNAYAQALAETGLAGALLLVLAVVWSAWCALRARRRSAAPVLAIALAAGLCFAAVHAFVDVDFDYAALAGVFFLLGGAATALEPSSRSVASWRVVSVTAVLAVGMVGLLSGELVVRAAQNPHSTEDRLELAGSLHPGDASPWQVLFSRRLARGDHPGVVSAATELRERDGWDPRVWVESGIAYESVGEPEQALRMYETAVLRDPVNPSLYESLADALARNGRVPEAYDAIDRGLQVHLRPSDEKYGQLLTLARFGEDLASRSGDLVRREQYRKAVGMFHGNV
jgi:O-antigen ligase/polysaccharide polymerase Wzy-like membrane protein/tetratricopeptide repeat protein